MEEEGALETCLADSQPDAVAYCAVPSQRSSEASHRLVSVEGIERVVNWLRASARRTLLVYMSTNAVFSGLHGPYREADIPDPKARQDVYRAYAVSRCRGEEAALDGWSNALVVRTATVNGRDVQGRLNERLAMPVERLLAGRSLPRFCDRYLSPTVVDNLADALLEVMAPRFEYRGIPHLAGIQRVTDHELLWSGAADRS